MAKIVYICTRDSADLSFIEHDLKRLALRLTPDHISASDHTVMNFKGIGFSIITPSEAIQIHGASVCLGNMEKDSLNWWEPGAPAPEGAYALFRGNEENIEIISDVVASRSIWYVHTEKLFIASTSQRAIISCLRSYKPNLKAYSWMLSSGCLGPELSWDRRICKLRGDSRIMLDRRLWKLKESFTQATFEIEAVSDQEHERRLENVLQTTFDRLNLDWKRYVLALSGGYDSRYSLVMLQGCSGLKCITWSTKAAMQDPDSDAPIARQLAQKYGLPHEYFFIDFSNEPVDRLFDRNLMATEGRIDHLSAAMDGFVRYKQMHEAGILGLIRSDEIFGWLRGISKTDVRRTLGLNFLTDYSNLSTLDIDELEPQELPVYLQQGVDESLTTWRDRLYQEFRQQYIIAALTEGRISYMEQVNPLLTRRIIQTVRRLPDHLRTNKLLFKRIVDRLVPDVPIANKPSTLSIPDLLSHQEVNTLFSDVLGSQQAQVTLPSGILNYVLCHLAQVRHTKSNLSAKKTSMLVRFLSKPLRQVMVSSVREVKKPSLRPERLALRCFIIVRMQQILVEDAQLLN